MKRPISNPVTLGAVNMQVDQAIALLFQPVTSRVASPSVTASLLQKTGPLLPAI